MINIQMNDYKNTIYYLISFVLGIIFLFVNVQSIMSVVLAIVGIFIVANNLMDVIVGLTNYDLVDKPKFITSCISFAIGLMLIFWQNSIVNLVLAVYFIVLPIIRIVKSSDRKFQLKSEIPYFVIAVILVVLGPWSILGILCKIFGGILIVSSIIGFITNYINTHKTEKDDNIIEAVILNERDSK